MTSQGEEAARVRIWRAGASHTDGGAPSLGWLDLMPTLMDELKHIADARSGDGVRTRLHFAIPQMSLTCVYFKNSRPPPVHVHNSDCLYHIVAGDLEFASTGLRAGDAFFVGKSEPFRYFPGTHGVVLLEFRIQGAFEMRVPTTAEGVWDPADNINAEEWALSAIERPPHLTMMERVGGWVAAQIARRGSATPGAEPVASAHLSAAVRARSPRLTGRPVAK